MKAKELAELLLDLPEFEVEFSFMDTNHGNFDLRCFENVKIDDVGHSDKVIKLGGDEK